jgi:hypothetical protein
MSSSLAMTSRLNHDIEATISRMVIRMRELSSQMRVADDLLAQMGGVRFLEDGVFDSDDDSTWSDFEHENVDSSDEDNDDASFVTAVYQSEQFNYDSDYDDDEETVVGEWEDPFSTPGKPIGGIIIPSDVDAGLDMLV